MRASRVNAAIFDWFTGNNVCYKPHHGLGTESPLSTVFGHTALPYTAQRYTARVTPKKGEIRHCLPALHPALWKEIWISVS